MTDQRSRFLEHGICTLLLLSIILLGSRAQSLHANSYSNCVTSSWTVPCPWNPALDVNGTSTYCVYRAGAVSAPRSSTAGAGSINFSGGGGGGGSASSGWTATASAVDEEVCRPPNDDEKEKCNNPRISPSKSACKPCESPRNTETVNSYVDLWGLQYFDSYNDLLISAPGGWLSATRTYTDGAWRSENTNLLTPAPPSTGGLKRINMSGRLFTQTTAAGTTYTSEDYIIEVAEAPSWEDSRITLTDVDGTWSTYRGTVAEGALLLKTGFKSSTYLIYEYDWDSHITGGKDLAELRLQTVRSGLETDDGSPKILLVYDYADSSFTKNGTAYPLLTKITSSLNGIEVEYFYYDQAGESGLLKEVRKADGTRSQYTYNANDNLQTKLEYDRHIGGNLTESVTITYHDTKLTTDDAIHSNFMYGALAGPSQRVASVTSGAGITKTFSGAYNQSSGGYYSKVSYSNGLTKETWLDDEDELIQRSLNGQVVYNRARIGRVERITTRGNSVTIHEYDEFENLISRTSPSGHQASWSYTGTLERIASHTDNLGATTTHTYDDDLSDNNDPALHEPTIKAAPYNATRSVQMVEVSQDGTLSRTTHQYHDTLDRMVMEIDALGHATAYTYKENTRQIEQARRLDLGPDEAIRYTQTFDELGYLETRTDAKGNTTTYDHDPHGRLLSTTNALQQTTQYSYSGQDLVQIEVGKTATQAGRITRYTYDGDGRRTAEIRVDAHGTQYRYTSYAHDAEGNLVSTTNADGHHITHSYDIYGNRATSKEPLPAARDNSITATHASTLQHWNAYGDLVSQTTPSGLTTTHTYDKEGRLLSTTEAQGQADERSISYRYDPADNIIATTYHLSDGSTHTTQTPHDGFGRRTSITGYGVYAESYTYDLNDNLKTLVNAKGLTTRYVYDALDRLEEVFEEYTDPVDGEVSVQVAGQVYDSYGNRLKSTDAEGIHTHFAYDALNRPRYQSIPLLDTEAIPATWWADFANVASERTYDRFGAVETTRATHGELTTNTYDDYGRLETVTIPAGATIEYQYTAADQIKRILFPVVSTSGQALNSEILYTYDALNPSLLATETARTGEVTAYRYDTALRRAYAALPTSAIRTMAYDAFGRLFTETDYQSLADYIAGTSYRSTEYTEYDDFDRLTTLTLPGGEGTQSMLYDHTGQLLTQSGANTYPIEYRYDEVGNLETLTTLYGDANPENASQAITTWEYDVRGRLVRKVYDDASDVDYDYYDNNRLLTRTNGRQQTTTYTYDAWGNPDLIDYPAGQVDIDFDYIKGRRETMTDEGGSTAWDYHPSSGLPKSETRTPLVGDATTIDWEYDGEGRRTHMTVDGLPLAIQPEPWQTSYNYDRYGRLQKISDARAHSSGSFVYAYETGTGLLEQIDSPWQQAGQADYLRQTRSHDNFGRLTSIKTVGSDNADLMGVVNIAYDPLDRRDGLSLFGGSLYASQQARDYDYDAFGQLKQQQSDSLITQEYEYDPIGNRLNYWEGDPLSVTPTTYTPNSLNQYEAYTPEGSPLTEPVYDDDGNLQEGANWTYTWNTENRLTQITKQDNTTQLRFIYDGLGRRVQKEVYAGDGSIWVLTDYTLFTYDGWNLIAEVIEKDLHLSPFTLLSSYTWGLDLSGSLQGAGGVGGLLSVVDKTGSPHLPTYDSNGNVMGYFQTDTETLVAEFEYGPFGELIRATGNKKDEFNFRFSTKYEDAETGFLYYGFRYYDPVTGRWLNRDPIAENGGLNLYGMVGNDPVNAWDYLGLVDCRLDCDELKQLLQNRQGLRGALKQRGIPDEVVDDFVELGRFGGLLGEAFIARTLYGDDITITNGSGAHSSTGGGNDSIQFDFSKPVLAPGFKDVFNPREHPQTDEQVRQFIGDTANPDFQGITTLSDYRNVINDAAWRRSTVVGHELGHHFLGIRDPFNVIVVDHSVQRGLQRAGLDETIAQTYQGRPLYPNADDDQFYHFPGNAYYLGYPKSIDVDQWWDSLGEARQSAREFLKDWGCD